MQRDSDLFNSWQVSPETGGVLDSITGTWKQQIGYGHWSPYSCFLDFRVKCRGSLSLQFFFISIVNQCASEAPGDLVMNADSQALSSELRSVRPWLSLEGAFLISSSVDPDTEDPRSIL